jgi:hypothetical protein
VETTSALYYLWRDRLPLLECSTGRDSESKHEPCNYKETEHSAPTCFWGLLLAVMCSLNKAGGAVFNLRGGVSSATWLLARSMISVLGNGGTCTSFFLLAHASTPQHAHASHRITRNTLIKRTEMSPFFLFATFTCIHQSIRIYAMHRCRRATYCLSHLYRLQRSLLDHLFVCVDGWALNTCTAHQTAALLQHHRIIQYMVKICSAGPSLPKLQPLIHVRAQVNLIEHASAQTALEEEAQSRYPQGRSTIKF